MKLNRRRMIQSTLGAGLAAAASKAPAARAGRPRKVTAEQIDRAAQRPVLKRDLFSDPVKIESIELLRSNRNYIVRTRSADGAFGIGITNGRAAYLYPILEQCVAPFFIGKDACDLDSLLDGVYRYQSNYKLAGLALWNPVAWIEFSILDMLGRIAGKPAAELLGTIIRREVPIYIASGRRETSPEEEVELLAKTIEETGVHAIKFKVGGRMSDNADSIPGRTEALIPLVRKRLGDDIVIHADSNGSYDPPKAIEVGRMLEKIDAHFFEEPCPFDHLEDTRRVADALSIPVAGGEQETSMRRWRWMIENGAVQIVQPDLHYNGGLIRATRVARMAAEAGMPATLHLSGGDAGYVQMLIFSSFTPNLGAFQEYKGGLERSGERYEPQLRMKDGAINVPESPGLGITEPEELLKGAKRIAGT